MITLLEYIGFVLFLVFMIKLGQSIQRDIDNALRPSYPQLKMFKKPITKIRIAFGLEISREKDVEKKIFLYDNMQDQQKIISSSHPEK